MNSIAACSISFLRRAIFTACLASVVLACETLNKAPNDASGTTANGSAANASNANGTGGASSSTTTSASSGNETIHLIGRFTTDANPSFAWSGSSIQATFVGTGISIKVDELTNQKTYSGKVAGNIYNVSVDGGTATQMQAPAGGGTYPLAQGLPSGTHTISFTKRNEASVGTARFSGLTVTGGNLISSARNDAHRILMIGDSITAGYGLLGTSPNCAFSPATQDADLTYGALTAKTLSAEVNIVAYSGKGIWRNNDGTTTSTLSDMFQLTLPDNSTTNYDLAKFNPQVIVINLGTNDFDADYGIPDSSAFQGAYLKMITALQASAPNAEIFCCLGPMLTDSYPVGQQVLTTARTYIQSVVSQVGAKAHFVEFKTLTAAQQACNYHPSAQAHVEMATTLTSAIRQVTNW